MKKTLALLLVVVMVLGLAACTKTPAQNPTVQYTDPYAQYADDYDALSAAVYADVLGEFNKYYQEALTEKSTAMRYAKMAIAEAKLLGAGVFLPTTSQGGNYAMTKIAPYTNTPVLWGNDTYRYHDRIVVTEPIKASDVAAMKAKWADCIGDDELDYETWVKSYLVGQGYTIKDTLNFYFDADPETWDVLATSNAADSEILVNTYDGLVEYDMENKLQPALAESWTVSEDGLKYTFKIRQGVIWVDNQGRKVADLTADDFVAGMQHMMDAKGGLEYLVTSEGAHIVGTDAYIGAADKDFSIVGVKAVDTYTLEYTLTEATDYFMTMLGYGVFAPLSRSYFESMGGKFGNDYNDELLNSESYKYGKSEDTIAYCGPFVITNFTSENTIVFESNESYWNADGNNLKAMTFIYTDGSNPQKPYDDFFGGIVDSQGMTAERIALAKEKGTFDTYAYISDTDATSYCGFFNVRRVAYANFTDATKGVSNKSEADKTRTGAAMLNQHFRLALAMSIDRGTYNAQSVGEDLKYNALINSYVPGNFVSLPEAITVEINGTATEFAAGTFYGEIVQAQLTADNVPLKVWDDATNASSGFDGWYNPTACAAELAKAVEELKAQGIEVSAANPVVLDIPVRTDSQTSMKQKNAMKQSIEASSNGLIKVNLVEYSTRADYLDATYWYETGSDANFDLNDGSGWGPDYGDPSTYLGTMLPNYAGYMTKSLGIF